MTIKGQTINESISKSNNDNLEDIQLKADKEHIIPKFTDKPGWSSRKCMWYGSF